MSAPPPAAPDRSWSELAWLLAVVLGALLWLGDKAFTIDDPMYLWLAEHIQRDPLDPFGFHVNWNASQLRMIDVNQNPPVTGYFIAAAAALFGWSERALHLAFLLPAGIATAATWGLARRFCARPLEASAVALATPAFLVSASNLMCEALLLGCWSLSILCWVRGFDRQSSGWWGAGAGLAALAFLTKFSAIALVPLLLLYGALRARRPGPWCAWLLLPLLVVAAYDAATASLYGVGHFTATLRFARAMAPVGLAPERAVIGLAFAGGCLAPALFYAPLLWSRRAWIAVAGLLALSLAAWPVLGDALGIRFPGDPGVARWALPLQLLLFTAAGASLLFLAGADLLLRRDADSVLLAAWLAGMLVFAAFVNWVANARSILPMAPAFGILLVRRLEQRSVGAVRPGRLAALGLSALLALAVADADRRWANDVRESAGVLARRHVGSGHGTYFLGNWGLQHYLAIAGATAVDGERWPRRGDRLIASDNNTDRRVPPSDRSRRLETLEGARLALRTMRPGVAGFYASAIGPLPFAWAPGRDRYFVWELTEPVRFGPSW